MQYKKVSENPIIKKQKELKAYKLFTATHMYQSFLMCSSCDYKLSPYEIIRGKCLVCSKVLYPSKNVLNKRDQIMKKDKTDSFEVATKSSFDKEYADLISGASWAVK